MPRTWSLCFLLACASALVPGAAVAGLPELGDPELLADLVPGPASSAPHSLVPVEGGGVFLGFDEDRRRFPWFTDGTADGTFPLDESDVDFRPELVPSGSLTWFQSAFSLDRERGLWRTDGTVDGTFQVAAGIEVSLSTPGRAPVFDPVTGLYFFEGRTGESLEDGEPWVSDGTTAGTRRLRDLVPGPDSVRVRDFVLHDGRVFFLGSAGPPSGEEVVLWTTDGTPAGTEIVATPEEDESFDQLVATPDRLFLVAGLGQGSGALWVSDGTTEGTVPIRSFGRTWLRVYPPSVYLFADLGDGRTLWRVTTHTSVFRSHLWVSDGTPEGTRQLLEVRLAAAPDLGGLYRGAVYFLENIQGLGYELWRTDGTPEGTGLAVDLCPGPCGGFALSTPRVVADRLVLFLGTGLDLGVEPVVSDGTPEGTEILGDLCPGECGSGFPDLIDLGGAVVFVASQGPSAPPGVGSRQLWITDMTAAGTRRVTSFPDGVTGVVGRLGDRLYLGVRDESPGGLGTEPWSMAIPSLGPLPPPGPWIRSPAVPGFEMKVRISAAGGARDGRLESTCIPETACFSGALPGRSEVFVRVVGPRPNGFLWPTMVKFTTSEVEVWIRRIQPGDTGEVRYYRLPGARPGVDELPGLFDRTGFEAVRP